jgi:soluble lytic murein transglycosylase-like protein
MGVVLAFLPVGAALAQQDPTRVDDSPAARLPGPNATRLPVPPSDFTFRKIAPPAPGTTRRITVQIAPLPDPPPPVRAEPDPVEREAPFAAEPREVASFWEVIGTGRAEAGPARLIDAMTWFDRADPAPASPALVDLMSLVEQYGRDMLSVSIGTRVSPAMALAVAWTESSGQVGVVSPKGAQGLMQLIPATAERFEVADPFNAQQNLRGGVAYLNWLMERFDGDPILALAGYNAGEGAVDRAQDGAGGVPNYPETREYVVKVLSAWRVARGLCLTPPELASDGCVFAPIASSN